MTEHSLYQLASTCGHARGSHIHIDGERSSNGSYLSSKSAVSPARGCAAMTDVFQELLPHAIYQAPILWARSHKRLVLLGATTTRIWPLSALQHWQPGENTCIGRCTLFLARSSWANPFSQPNGTGDNGAFAYTTEAPLFGASVFHARPGIYTACVSLHNTLEVPW